MVSQFMTPLIMNRDEEILKGEESAQIVRSCLCSAAQFKLLFRECLLVKVMEWKSLLAQHHG